MRQHPLMWIIQTKLKYKKMFDPVKFTNEALNELPRITWASKAHIRTATILVLSVVIVVGIALSVVDFSIQHTFSDKIFELATK